MRAWAAWQLQGPESYLGGKSWPGFQTLDSHLPLKLATLGFVPVRGHLGIVVDGYMVYYQLPTWCVNLGHMWSLLKGLKLISHMGWSVTTRTSPNTSKMLVFWPKSDLSG